ncbi:2-C-methyl-D-erythritol 2,4-cyclodiphosphate synthase [Loktanella fryxellensis]|uniref:Bifunctional enzyme IspD/IspF n=1 Tax=Loktanella fryxellensis TaxID=245187 RepID=A0A1H8I3W8_9RHOB|nr:bifunctional 2-C-methyl-D-erythritol 4-phosphate cytidylyltransferase/2-C-methyl-D-erythritol 2,4-cyclodiphosphate synthase [Loktanella fryxellensis]SEN62726.1 2-C-methyl-D-erythritol 2,4-cyclodiphosphate synthase [Loktanella fryxellensis]
MTRTAALIVAAGRGLRAGGGEPKQWRDLAGQSVLARSIAAFADHPAIDAIVLVLHADDLHRWTDPGIRVVTGGDTRQASVLAGLAQVEADRVLIHDAARPLVSVAVIDRVIAALDTAPGAAPALPVNDALWRGDDHVTGVADRTGLWRAQTPQGFLTAAIRAAHLAHPAPATDDVAVARAAGLDVAIVAGDDDNLKITTAGDFTRAERLLAAQGKDHTMDVRLGNGYDVHRFGPGDHVMLCGVAVPHPRGLNGHSDADVGMHAITDAVYGALAQGDIGVHFPPSDPQWKGAESRIFLRHAVDLATQMGFRIANVDCTLVCEHPKVGPHQAAMRAALSDIMGVAADRISVKATTSERLGFTGREEGIAALATATLVAS